MQDHISTASNWSEMVRAIEAEKRAVFDSKSFVPAQRVTFAEKKRAEREYDVVAGRYRDQVREELYQTNKLNTLRTRGLLSTQRIEGTFNIINHHGPPRKIEQKPPMSLESTGRPWHIMSCLEKNDHVEAPLLYSEQYIQQKLPKKPANVAPLGPKREFDVISNKYKENHEEREQREVAALREDISNKYWSTHDYNIVQGEYYNSQKEEQYRHQREEVAKVHGLSKSLRLPPSVTHSEGKTFNILASSLDGPGNSTLPGARVSRANGLLVAMRQRGEERLQVEEERRLNRASFKRWEETHTRGFNILTNFAEVPPAPRPKRPVTVWDRLQSHHDGDLNNSPTGTRRAITSNRVNLSGNAGLDLSPDPSQNSLSPSPVKPMYSSESNGITAVASLSKQRSETGVFSTRMAATPAEFRSSAESRNSERPTVPPLSMERTAPPEPITYNEPKDGPPGLPVMMVRTGGLSHVN